MFIIVPLVFLLPKKASKALRLLIALLSVGMFISPIVSALGNVARNYKFHPHFLLDYFAHYALSAWGIYIIQSKQVTLQKKDVLFSSCIIFFTAITMLILNVIFDTAFFGLSLRGKHNIYNVVLVLSSYLSAFLYLFGLTFVLFLGYFLQKLLLRLLQKEDTKQS